MSDNKKRVSVNIGGSLLTLITDESAEFVELVADTLNKKMRTITKNSFRIPTVDAALLCAIDETSDRLKAEKRLRTLEAQLALYEADIASLKAQLETVSAAAEKAKDSKSPEDTLGRDIGKISGAKSRADKIKALEKYLDGKKDSFGLSSSKAKEEKIRYIEQLLRDHEKSLAPTVQIDLFDTIGDGDK